MYSRNTANGRGRGIVPPYNYGGTVYSRALRDAQESGERRDGGDRVGAADRGSPIGNASVNASGGAPGNASDKAVCTRSNPSGDARSMGIPASAQGAARTVRAGGMPQTRNDAAQRNNAAQRTAAGMRQYAGDAGTAGNAGRQISTPDGMATSAAAGRVGAAASDDTFMHVHVGGRAEGDYPPRSYPDALGRGGRPTGDDAPRPVRHDRGTPPRSGGDIGALLDALPPSDDILLIFLLVTLMSARSEGRGGDDLLIAIIALLLLSGR